MDETHPKRHFNGGVRIGCQKDDGKVPKIHPIASFADPYKRSKRKEPRNKRIRHNGNGYEQCGENRYKCDASQIREAIISVRKNNECNEASQSGKSDDVEKNPSAGFFLLVFLNAERCRWCGKRKPYTDQETDGTRVGSVINAARVGIVRVIKKGHLNSGSDGKQKSDATDPRLLKSDAIKYEQKDRPDNIELLFDGQAPEMLKRRSGAGCFEIGYISENLPPIVVEEK